MEFFYIFVVSSSLALLLMVLVQAAKNSSVAGSKPFIWQILFVTVWSIGSLMEMLSSTVQSMLLWRNVEQIGVFMLPVACVYFAVDYARYEWMKKYLPLLLMIPVAAIVLIFTDSSTHIMRYGYIVSYSPLFGKALSVRQTGIGMAFVAYNYTLALVSLTILYVFSRQVARNMRRQTVLVLVATTCIFLFGLFKAVFLEGTRINIPIVTLYLPTGLMLYYNLYRNNFFRISPIARDKIFDVMEMGIIVIDNLGMIVDINPFTIQMLSDVFGMDEKLVGMKMNDVFKGYPKWVELTQANAIGETELEILSPACHFVHITVHPLQSQQGALVGSVTIMRDVTELRMQQSDLKMKAEIDGLTGLLNRNSFTETFADKLEEAVQSGERISVLMMDLDKLKYVNDTYGHDSGDLMIKAFADVLKVVLRHEDAVARIGGDEFVAVLPGVNNREALEISRRILKTANERAVNLGEETSPRLAISIGVCDNEFVKSEELMLKCADMAMYKAKKMKGNCCLAWKENECK